MKRIFLDIETIPSQSESLKAEIAANITPPGNMSKSETISAWERDKKPGLIEETWRKTSFDGAYGRIVVIGAAIDDEPPELFWASPEAEVAENAVLNSFFEWLDKNVTESQWLMTEFIGHYVVDFDLRFIFQRAVIHGIKPPFWMPFNHRHGQGRIFDTMQAWCGQRDKVSLDKLCQVLGIAGKGSEIGDEIDGSKVWDFVKSGRIKDVVTYCAGDVERAREVYKRLTFQR